jgi:hypothetical protein
MVLIQPFLTAEPADLPAMLGHPDPDRLAAVV